MKRTCAAYNYQLGVAFEATNLKFETVLCEILPEIGRDVT